MGLIFVLVILGLMISYIIADEFSTIASIKGYNDRKYFWYCFLFGIAGYLMVIGLPIKKTDNTSQYNKRNAGTDDLKTDYIGDIPVYDFSESDGIKQCPNCGVCHDSDLSICPSCKYEYN